MSNHPSAVESLPPYRVRTHNASEQSENRMHSDEVARKFGFKGALVPGVTVFAHMTRPLVERFGEVWLARSISEVSFAKPAYEGDLLTVCTQARAAGDYELVCSNEAGVELARMTSAIPAASPAIDERSETPPAAPLAERPLVTWDLMSVGTPFPALVWTPSLADNLQWCDDVRDDLPLYRSSDAPALHPGFVLRQANMVLRSRFNLPAWIHTGSRLVFHELLRVGPSYQVRAIPEEKWERKGHRFVRLYVAIRRGHATVAEVVHTAIFQPRAAE